MIRRSISYRIVTALLLAAITIDNSISAAEIQAGLSGRETYVGLPVTLQIRIGNVSKYERPDIPEVDGLSIRSSGTPSQSSQVTIINGRRSESTSITYSYRVTPQREGSFTIPPIKIKADGAIQQTKAMRLSATKSETGDLMFVEVEGKQDSIYVGQSLDLTLKIWLRPYRDEQRQIVLSEGDVWNLISSETSWGPFADRIQELAEDNKRPGGEEVLREDGDGEKRSYYLYEIDATIYPQRAGTIDGQDIQVIVQYPTALDKSRDPFSSFFNEDSFPFRSNLLDDDFFSSRFGPRLRIKSIRPITAEASVASIKVKPVPDDQRPSDYRGAVGKYQIATQAKPTKVTAGDPITLHIGISGDGPMDRIQAPPLAKLKELSADFKVPDQQLAGFVDRTEKVFSTTIRPKQAGITEIPAIPFSYFDPEAEKFVTVYSQPISIEVGEAETLALDAIVGRETQQQTKERPTESVSTPAASFENFTGKELLVSTTSANRIRELFPLLLAGPPLIAFVLLLIGRRKGLSRMASRIRSPRRELDWRIEQAQGPEEVASALSAYVHRRLRTSGPSDNQSLAIGTLRATEQRDLANDLERLINDCQSFAFAGPASRLDVLRERAIEFANTLDRQLRLAGWTRSTRSTRQINTTASIVLLIALTGQAVSAGDANPSASIDTRQQLMLSEANELYGQALETANRLPAESKLLANRAAEKYQWIVDAGVSNPKLYFNLANAYFKSGQAGRAIANYHRAIRMDPTVSRFRDNLQLAQSSLSRNESGSDELALGLVQRLKRGADQLFRYVAPMQIGWSAIVCWSVIWVVIALRILGYRLPWKSLVSVMFLLFACTAVSYGYSVHNDQSRDLAIIVAEEVTLRTGDGENFDQVGKLQDSEGESVRVLHCRGEWAQVRTDSGQIGWIPLQQLEVI